ncbi:putative ATP-dependent helicase [Vanrija pseudolonga]|uniref:Purtative ATP-dependent helicase n=1 Tax=Vanrija pseudolonga TaxID=143232 RepID=A0AAF1BMH6_9TREE|nr:purtative ATP-dependent helicase [Vanrija pseudolonga]
MAPDAIKLGTVVLARRGGPGGGGAPHGDPGPWEPLDAAFLEDTDWPESEADTVALLLGLLHDLTLGAYLEQRATPSGTIIRVSVLPNDNGRWRAGGARTKRLKALFKLLDRGWDGGEGRLLATSEEEVGVGMQALYALIESPPEPAFGEPEFIGDQEAFDGLAGYENPPGVQTMMYKYQIRSVARMLQMETNPATMVSTAYSSFMEQLTGQNYYVNLSTMDIRRYPERFPLSRGGILCEQMGVGKTLMCLALVLASRHQATLPPPGATDISEVVTDVAVKTYSTASMAALRLELDADDDELAGTPSLSSMCADIIVQSNPAAGWTRDLPISPVAQNLLNNRKCMYFRFPPPARLPRGAKRVPYRPAEPFVLAPTTLIVVPPILVPQWVQEAESHLQEGALRILVIKEGKEPLPPMEELVQHDIVLMSLDRFRREGHRDPDALLSTELLRARWKRIILDEGNIANNTKSDAMTLAETLSIERRWIVSGTPTTHLKQGTEVVTQSFLESEGLTSPTKTKSAQKTKKWSKADLDDVTRLGNMLKGFLAAEVFQSENFARLVTSPLRSIDGPIYGAVDRIRTIMSAVMVKHRPGIIDEEVALPPSTLTAEKVHFTNWQRLTYNALTALVASNVYTSGFEDADYFLHPRNTEAFNQVVANLHLACFWFSSADMDIEGALERSDKHLEKKGHKLNEKQRQGVIEAISYMRQALEAPGWAEWFQHAVVSIPYDGSGLPASILDAWSESPDGSPTTIDAHALRLLRGLNKRGADVAGLCREGWEERGKRPYADEYAKAMEKAEKKWRATGGEDVSLQTASLPHHRSDTKAAADKPKAPRVVRVKAGGKEKAKDDDVIDVQLNLAATNAARAADLSSVLPRPLPSILRTSSQSAKSNYVIQSVTSAPEDDKFVIFGTFEEIAHLTEALDLAGITSVYAGAHVAADARKKALKDFAKPEMRVCLLELKFAARGLTLTLANRMLFVSPVWSLDVQAQAIKRIHRIGQSRPTHIEILVTEGTFEEDIVRREAASRSSDEEKSYSRALIENPRYVTAEADKREYFPVKLVPVGSELTSPEKEELARALGAVTPPSRTPNDTPLITPGTPLAVDVDEKPVLGKRGIRFTEDEPAGSSGKRARFASPARAETTKRTRFASPEPTQKRARFAD